MELLSGVLSGAADFVTVIGVIGLLILVQQAGFWQRARFKVVATVLPRHAHVGSSIPGWELIVDNREGEMPVTISDLRTAVGREPDHFQHQGVPQQVNACPLYLDGSLSSNVIWMQEFHAVNYLSRDLVVPAHATGRIILTFEWITGRQEPFTPQDTTVIEGRPLILMFNARSGAAGSDFHATENGLFEGTYHPQGIGNIPRPNRRAYTLGLEGSKRRRQLHVVSQDDDIRGEDG